MKHSRLLNLTLTAILIYIIPFLLTLPHQTVALTPSSTSTKKSKNSRSPSKPSPNKPSPQPKKKKTKTPKSRKEKADEKSLDSEDYYKVLGLKKPSNKKGIKKSYRTLALKYHPDKNPDDQEAASANFAKISAAYKVLNDPKKKVIYDKYGLQGLQLHEKGGDPSVFGPGGSSGGGGGGGGGRNNGFNQRQQQQQQGGQTFNYGTPQGGGSSSNFGGGRGGGGGGGGGGASFDPFEMFNSFFGKGNGNAKQQQQNNRQQPKQQAKELYPSTLTDIKHLSTSKFPSSTSMNIWLILFYKNDSKECQVSKENFIKLASGLKSSGVKIGVVDCGLYASLCSDKRIVNHPTYAVYNGSLNVYSLLGSNIKSLHEFVLSNVLGDSVHDVNHPSRIARILGSSSGSDKKLGVLLLTDKYSTPVLWLVLSYKFRSNNEMSFGVSRGKSLVMGKAFNLKRYPMIVVVDLEKVDLNAGDGEGLMTDAVVGVFDGVLNLDEISLFLKGFGRKSKKKR